MWTTILMGMGIGLESFGQIQQSEAMQHMLKERELQVKINADKEAIDRDNKMTKILAYQTVSAAKQGITVGSFSPIIQHEFDEFAKDRRTENLNAKIKEDYFKETAKNIKSQELIGIAKNLTEGTLMYDLTKKTGKDISSKDSVFLSLFKKIF